VHESCCQSRRQRFLPSRWSLLRLDCSDLIFRRVVHSLTSISASMQKCKPQTDRHVQVDSSKFVQRKGLRLVLNGQTYKFAGASNYYMLTRAVEKVTRPQVFLTPTLAIVKTV
jgi:hypothetical protein